MRGVETYVRYQRVFLLLLIVAAMLTTGFVYLQSGTWRDAKKEADQLDKELGNPDKLRSQVSNLRNAIVTQRLKIQHLELNLPTSEYIPTMLGELEQMGYQSGLRITGVRPEAAAKKKPAPSSGDSKEKGAPKEGTEKKEPPKPYDELDISIEAEGMYPQVLVFLENLGRFPKIIAVRSVTMSTRQQVGRSGPPYLDVTFGVRAYIFKPKQTTLASRPQDTGTEEAGGG